jgi:hypothetical protein
VKKMFAFKLIPEVCMLGQKCLNWNPKLSKKIESHSFRLGKKDATIDAWFLPDRDGVSTMNESFLLNYVRQDAEMAKKIRCSPRQSSEVLRELWCDQTDDCQIMLKMDVEGAEYKIMHDRVDNYCELFDRVAIIIGDSHLGFDEFHK